MGKAKIIPIDSLIKHTADYLKQHGFVNKLNSVTTKSIYLRKKQSPFVIRISDHTTKKVNHEIIVNIVFMTDLKRSSFRKLLPTIIETYDDRVRARHVKASNT